MTGRVRLESFRRSHQSIRVEPLPSSRFAMFEPKITIELVDLEINREIYEREICRRCRSSRMVLRMTRCVTGDQVTKALHYEVHREMAIQQMLKIAEEAARKFSSSGSCSCASSWYGACRRSQCSCGLFQVHRPGSLFFSALPWIMEVLKRDVPVWKQDLGVNDANWIHPWNRTTQPNHRNK